MNSLIKNFHRCKVRADIIKKWSFVKIVIGLGYFFVLFQASCAVFLRREKFFLRFFKIFFVTQIRCVVAPVSLQSENENIGFRKRSLKDLR